MINATDLLMALCYLGLVYVSFCDELCIFVEVEYLSMWELQALTLFSRK
jgi:hypothetical protein